ncbi:nuclease domain-containing protein [Achromobacter xylosoxidans]|uniref:nuclease domain-containing protein n=1 Tax=Alcaligenes xylosoxydans xylosoxydans TaxID=85698 RepID=UPI001F1331A5|nr:nuclease domain-containing protein [Achromobacter xylosoxidans]
MLKRSAPLTRKTPLRATGFRRALQAFAGKDRQPTLQRAPIKRRAPKKRPGHEPKYLTACRGEPCYLQIPGVCRGACERDTVVPCHANWSDYGKGMGIKAPDIYTVPGCARCHACLDQGMTLTKAEKKATWEWAYTRWSAARSSKLQEAL